MDASFRTRPSAFEEALDIVRRLLAGEIVRSSRRFRITEASVALRPAEPVEVWIGASAPPAIDARHGWRSAESPAPVSPARRRAHRPIFTRARRRLRLHPAAIALRRDIYVGESSAEAQAVLQQVLDRGLSRHRGRSSDRRIGRRSRESVSDFRRARLHRDPSCVISPIISQRSWARWSGWRRCARRWPRRLFQGGC
jgi:alkanesulfonate monooxygenase SsuD/methylene tetrahydromethanopterin reductase-like flavin-dependent oxidoreductase (luciferase family)